MSASTSASGPSKKRERTETEPEVIDVSKRAKVAENQAPSSSSVSNTSKDYQEQQQQYSAQYWQQAYGAYNQAAYPSSAPGYAYYPPGYAAGAYGQYQTAAYPPEAYAAYGAYNVAPAVSTDPTVDPLAYPGDKPSENGDKKKEEENKTTRSAAGRVWEDLTMDQWPENDFRIHVGNLGPEVDDKMLHEAFNVFPTLAHWRVIKDKRYDTSKGYGFVSFLDPREGLKALKAMNGKYIGSRPVKVTKSTHEKRAVASAGHHGGKKR